MDEDSSESYDSSLASDSDDSYEKRKEIETFETSKKIKLTPKTLKSTKIVLSLETKNKLEEIKEVQEKQKPVEDKKTTEKEPKIEEKKETTKTEEKQTTKQTEKDSEEESKQTEKDSEEESKQTEKDSEEESKQTEKDSEEESEYEDEDSPKKQTKPPKTPEATEYDPKNVHYEGDIAVYTDPKSGYQYKWCNETNQWLPKSDITYGFEDDVHTYTDAEGVKYFWDVDRNAWFPKIDDDFMARYQMNYGFVDNKAKDDDETEKIKDETEKPEKKNEEEKGVKRKIDQLPPSWFEMSDQQNTKVYVSNLPTDVTEEEFVDLMQKCGLVMRDLQTGKMKVKLYTVPETDILKGDGLCTYIKIESVELALNLLDGYVHRGKKLKIERAKFEMKGAYDPKLKPKKRRRKDKDKLKKMQDQLFDWRPEKMRGERSKHERIVIIKNLFEPALFDEDVSLILEYQQDLREECSKCGEVKRVLLYDRHPEGVAQITMKLPEEADEVVNLLNGRWFGKRKLTAEIYDGKTKYKIAETDSEISQRLDNWDKYLETAETSAKTVQQPEETIAEPALDN